MKELNTTITTEKNPNTKHLTVDIFEMPLDFGASRHGSDMGPSAIRLAGLTEGVLRAGASVKTYRNSMAGVIDENDCREVGNERAKYLKPIVKCCTALYNDLMQSFSNGHFPLVIGGDHSVALGSIAASAAFAKARKKTLGVLYVDAHGDFNTSETTLTGNIHGQCLAASAGLGLEELVNLGYEGMKVDPQNICFVGTRDLDSGERTLMKAAGVTVFSMSDIERLGFFAVVKKVLVFFKSRVDVLHVSFDMDSLDPMFAPGTGIQVSAGLTNREALLLMEEIGATDMVQSAEFVEVNPVLDVRNQTASLAVDLIARLLGERIY